MAKGSWNFPFREKEFIRKLGKVMEQIGGCYKYYPDGLSGRIFILCLGAYLIVCFAQM